MIKWLMATVSAKLKAVAAINRKQVRNILFILST
jgi:hypothetical protein